MNKKTNLRVCVVTHTFPRDKKDPTAPFMREFAQGLSQAGADVTVLTPWTRNLVTKTSSFGINTYKYIWPDIFHRLGYSRAMSADVSLKFYNYFLIPFMIIFGVINLIRISKNKKIDIVNVHWILPNGLIAYIASFFTKVPYVITLPGTDVYLVKKSRLLAHIAKAIADRSVGITSNNTYFLDTITQLGVDKPTEVISYPSDISIYKPSKRLRNKWRTTYKISSNTIVLTGVGRFVYKKGFEYLIKSFAKLNKLHKNTMLVLVGDGLLRSEYEKLVDSLGVGGSTLFAGMIQRDDLSGIYNMSDIFVVPSVIDKKGNVDGSPVALVEAMACGVPAVITNVVGISNDFKEKDYVSVVKEKNVQELTSSLSVLCNNNQKRKRYGARCATYATHNLSTRIIGNKYCEFFKKTMYE